MKLSAIQIRDPFVLPLKDRGLYYLFGSTDRNVWNGPGCGFECYRSRDLQDWDGPVTAFCPKADFWATTQFWAPEVYAHNGRFYMFATFKAPSRCRGTQVLVSADPEGPFEPWSDGPVTPAEWECLDGTLHIDAQGGAWMVFCHEWVQVRDGAIYAMRLTADLKQADGAPVPLFSASQAPWVHCLAGHAPGLGAARYVTDGPFLHRTPAGALLMVWSSFGSNGYAMGVAQSCSGSVLGPWIQHPTPLWAEDGGHGMLFRGFDGRLFVTVHRPNITPGERALILEIAEDCANTV